MNISLYMYIYICVCVCCVCVCIQRVRELARSERTEMQTRGAKLNLLNGGALK